MTIFDPEDVADDLEPGTKPDSEDDKDDADKDTAPDFKDFRIPDDYEDEDLRGLDGQSLLQALKQSKELTKRAIEQANSVSGAATAAATAATVAATAGTRPAAVKPTEITKEDLLLADPVIINKKLDDIFAEKARPVLIEQFTRMSHQALALARTDTKNMPFWEEYEDEIVARANKLSVDLTANMETWKGLYAQVTALHQPEIIEREVAKRLKKGEDDNSDGAGDKGGGGGGDKVGRRVRVVDTGETGKGGGGGGGGDGAAGLNDEQRRTANLLGVSHEDYAKYAKEEE